MGERTGPHTCRAAEQGQVHGQLAKQVCGWVPAASLVVLCRSPCRDKPSKCLNCDYNYGLTSKGTCVEVCPCLGCGLAAAHAPPAAPAASTLLLLAPMRCLLSLGHAYTRSLQCKAPASGNPEYRCRTCNGDDLEAGCTDCVPWCNSNGERRVHVRPRHASRSPRGIEFLTATPASIARPTHLCHILYTGCQGYYLTSNRTCESCGNIVEACADVTGTPTKCLRGHRLVNNACLPCACSEGPVLILSHASTAPDACAAGRGRRKPYISARAAGAGASPELGPIVATTCRRTSNPQAK